MKFSKLNLLMLLVSGSGIGWLAGLSVSPVIAQIIGAILGVLAAVLAVLSGVKWSADQQDDGSGEQVPSKAGKHALQKISSVSAIPTGILIIGLVIGSMLGMTARTHDWFGFDPAREIDQWIGFGLDKKEVAQVLLQAKFGPGGKAAGTGAKKQVAGGTQNPAPRTTSLFGVTGKECAGLYELYDLPRLEELRLELKSSPNQSLRQFESKLDDSNLKEVIRIICDW